MFILSETVQSTKLSQDSLESVSDHSCDDIKRPTKRKCSAQSDVHSGHRPPGFWDRLSKVHLTPGVLREFDRRSAQSRQQSSLVSTDSGASTESRIRQLTRFSQHGGPDLSHIRGFALAHDQDGIMSQPTSSQKQSAASGPDDSTRGDSMRESRSAYASTFQQNLIDGGIHPHDEVSIPTNMDEIRDSLPQYRASLSPSRFGDAEFKDFKALNSKVVSESRVMADVLTIIEGNGRHKYHCGGPNHLLNHLTPLTECLPNAKPDQYDGALPKQIHERVRRDLGQHIVLCNNSSRPAAPNFFVEGKSASGRADVAKLQACHDGAIGARAMDSLQNYGASEPEYDGNMKSYSATYHPGTGTLQLYGHHTTLPQTHGGRPEYHMTQIDAFAMTGNARNFREGATAFRNLRDLAQKCRDELIDRANRAARLAPIESLSTTFTGSGTPLSVIHESEPDTSAD